MNLVHTLFPLSDTLYTYQHCRRTTSQSLDNESRPPHTQFASTIFFFLVERGIHAPSHASARTPPHTQGKTHAPTHPTGYPSHRGGAGAGTVPLKKCQEALRGPGRAFLGSRVTSEPCHGATQGPAGVWVPWPASTLSITAHFGVYAAEKRGNVAA